MTRATAIASIRRDMIASLRKESNYMVRHVPGIWSHFEVIDLNHDEDDQRTVDGQYYPSETAANAALERIKASGERPSIPEYVLSEEQAIHLYQLDQEEADMAMEEEEV